MKKSPQPNYHIKRRATGRVIETAFTGADARARADQLALGTKARHYVHLRRRRGGWRVWYRTPSGADTARKRASSKLKRTWESIIAQAEADILKLRSQLAALRKSIRLAKRELKAHVRPDGTDNDIPVVTTFTIQIGRERFAIHSFAEDLPPVDLSAAFAKRVKEIGRNMGKKRLQAKV